MIEGTKEVGPRGVGVLDSSLERLLSEQVKDWMRGIANRSSSISNGGHRSAPNRK